MEKYIKQLLADIAYATENISLPYIKKESYELHDWLSEEEENKTAPVRQLEDWTGIRKEQLPPAEKLSDEQVHLLLEALKKMLNEYNWSFVLQIEVPELRERLPAKVLDERGCFSYENRSFFHE